MREEEREKKEIVVAEEEEKSKGWLENFECLWTQWRTRWRCSHERRKEDERR